MKYNMKSKLVRGSGVAGKGLVVVRFHSLAVGLKCFQLQRMKFFFKTLAFLQLAEM